MRSRLLIRMTAPILAVSVPLLAVAVVAGWYVQRLQKNTSDLLALNVASMRAAEELEIGIRDVRLKLIDFLLTGDRRHLDAVPALRADTDRWLGEAERLATTEHEQRLMARVRRGYDQFFTEFGRLARQPPGPELKEGVRALTQGLLPTEILGPAHEYLDFNEQEAARASERNQALAGRMLFAVWLLGGGGTVAGALAGYVLARALRRSLVQLHVPIRDAAGQLNAVVGPLTFSLGWSIEELEGTLRKLARHVGTVIERLQQSQREVLRAEQLAGLGQLAAGLAHELRNPLMAMKILVQSGAEQGGAAGLGGRDLRVLEEEIGRLEHLVQAFLDFARPPRPEKTTFDLRDLIEQQVHLVSGRAARRGVRVECDLPDRPVPVEADVGQLRQLLLNLLLNALDATPGEGTVRVRLARHAGRWNDPGWIPGGPTASFDRWLTLEVADSGRGLPAELGARIFEPFVSTKEAGTGLGLTICRRIVEAHGGEILAANRPGGGAVFTVRLPLTTGAGANSLSGAEALAR